jgi:hypothetical protein
LSLNLGVNGSLLFQFNKTTHIGASISVNPSFSFGYSLPTSYTVSSSALNGVSITVAEPSSFMTNSGAGSVVTGNIPTLTASGTDAPALLSATADLVALAVDLITTIPVLAPFSVIDGSFGVTGATISYALISAPLTAALNIGQSVTLTPGPIGVSITDQLNSQTETGTLGQAFSFTAPTSGSGTIPLQTTYTLPVMVSSATGVQGQLSLAIEGPQIHGSVIGAGFTLGPLGSFGVFNLTTGLGTIYSSNFTQSLTTSETYSVNYGGPPCYMAGTRILTERGAVAVEHLAAGDIVVTASGGRRPVRWVGSRRIDCTRHPEPKVVWPVCIEAQAFGVDQPARDLWVSPGHSILIDGVLMQAGQLVNGATIRQVRRPRVEYWHVELDEHDCLLAEGLAAESYLDTGNRTEFVNGGDFLDAYPDFKPKHFRDTCLPLVLEGPLLSASKARLLLRAQELGYRLTTDADMHLMADGRRIEALQLAERRWALVIPQNAARIELCARGFVPAHTEANSRDPRTLGICVGRLQLDGLEVDLGDAAICSEGWHKLETYSNGHRHRWTRERVPLPAGTRLVVIDIASNSYSWEKPAPTALARVG